MVRAVRKSILRYMIHVERRLHSLIIVRGASRSPAQLCLLRLFARDYFPARLTLELDSSCSLLGFPASS